MEPQRGGPRASSQQRLVKCALCTGRQAPEGGTGREAWQRLKKDASAHFASIYSKITLRGDVHTHFSRKASKVTESEMKGTVWSF